MAPHHLNAAYEDHVTNACFAGALENMVSPDDVACQEVRPKRVNILHCQMHDCIHRTEKRANIRLISDISHLKLLVKQVSG